MGRPEGDLACLKDEVFNAENRRAFARRGYLLVDDALLPGVADQILADLEDRTYLKVESPTRRKGVTTFYSKNGPRLFEASSLIAPLEREIVALTSYVAEAEFIPLDNRSIGASVNITPPGGGFETHFDRQEVSAVIYLNSVEGGALDLWPRLRRWERIWPGTLVQRMTFAMTLALPPVSLTPKAGSVLLFTRESPHRVAEVGGDRPRVSVVFGLDRPGHTFLTGQVYYGDAEETIPVGKLR